MRRTYHFWPVIDGRYYTAIGHAIVVWAYLETEIDHHIASLLHDSKTWRHPLSKTMDRRLPRTFRQRIILWKRLARIHYSGEALSEIRKIISRCKIVRKTRNKIAHGRWMMGIDKDWNDTIFINLPKDGIEYAQDEPITVGEIRDATSEITLIVRDLMDFERDHFPSVAPPPPHPEYLRSAQGR